jgi:hypothetical protein
MPKLFKTTEGGQNGEINWMFGRSQSDIRYVITMDTTEAEDVTIIAGMSPPEDIVGGVSSLYEDGNPWSVDYYLTSNGQKLDSDDIAALQQWLQEDLD